MSDIHLLDQVTKQDSIRCAFHIAIPAAGNNEAGIQWRTAIVQYQTQNGAAIESAVPGLDTTAHDLDDGSVYEKLETVRFAADATPAVKAAAIQAAYTARKSALLQNAQNVLEWWGHELDEA